MVIVCCIAAILSVAIPHAFAEPPYPPSPIIDHVEFDASAGDRRAPGSDNWPMTWADDDHQYTAWGDGGGFGGTNDDGRVSLGVARVEGSGDDYRGHNVWGGKDSDVPATFEGKSYGIISLVGALYMWVSPGSGRDNYREARLAVSRDHGRSWERMAWAFDADDALMDPTFCQFQRDYAGARDEYVYTYATQILDTNAYTQRPGRILLMRAPASSLTDRAAYAWFAGWNTDGAPRWSHERNDRQPVFEDPDGTRRVSVSYNAGLRRYLLCTAHSDADAGNLGMFDAPEPWGPWTTVAYEWNWCGFGSVFYWVIPTKWLSPDGLRFTMVFTGTDNNDAWNTVPGRFVLRDTRDVQTP